MKKWILITAVLLLLAGCHKEQAAEHTHTFGDWQVVTAETCTELGKWVRKCTCGEQENQVTDALGHDYQSGVCTHCGKTETVSEGLEFSRRVDGTYMVSGIGTCRDRNLIIPAEQDGIPVTAIGEKAFAEEKNIQSVLIPEGITAIEADAFGYCSALKKISIPSTVTSIEGNVFISCPALAELTVAEGNTAYRGAGNCLVELGNGTLITGCHSSVIPDDGSVRVIGEDAFFGCTTLKGLKLPDSVTEIKSGAFRFCDAPEGIDLPAGLQEIEENAFGGDSYAGTVVRLSYGGTYATWSTLIDMFWCRSEAIVTCIDQVWHSDCEYSIEDEVIKAVTCTEKGTVRYACICGQTVTETVNAKGHDFYNGNDCSRCDEPAPDGLGLKFTYLVDGTYAVSGKGSYRGDTLVIPSTYKGKPVSTVAADTFYVATQFTSLVIEEGVRVIEEGAFAHCQNLERVTLPESLEIIGDNAFNQCLKLTEITVPEGVTALGGGAFKFCDALKKATLPDSLVTIGNGAFAGCESLAEINIPDGVTSIGANAFWRCYSLTELVLPDSVTALGEGVFEDCQSLEKLTLSNSLTVIPESAFCGCESLKFIDIPVSVTRIEGTYVFYQTRITELQLKNPDVKLGGALFNGCNTLKKVVFAGTKAQWAQASAELLVYEQFAAVCQDGSLIVMPSEE